MREEVEGLVATVNRVDDCVFVYICLSPLKIRHRAGKRQSPGLGPRFLEDTATRYTQNMEQLIIYGMTWTACGR